MLVVQAIILGIVQGLTEFIPVSSSAHLVIIPWLFGWSDTALSSLSFDVALHLGTLAAVVIFFWKDWQDIVKGWFLSIRERNIGDDGNRRMAWYLILATIPGALAGLLFEGRLMAAFHGMLISQSAILLMAFMIALMGALLWLADARAAANRSFSDIRLKDALFVGCAQALAIFPGVSRSGATITAARAGKLDRASAARFSFLLSAPIIAGSGLKSLYDIAKMLRAGGLSGTDIGLFAIGIAASALAGIFCIRFLLAFLQKYSYKSFALYRFALAALLCLIALAR